MAGLTDEKAALVQMNHAMGKVVEQMERLAVSAGMAGHAIQKDFTEQIAHLHWVSSAIFDTMPFDGARHAGGGFAGGRYFGDMESGVLAGHPSVPAPTRRSGGGSAGPSLPPSMRVRKYSGMGGPTDLFAHLGSEFATGHFMQALLKKGTPETLEHAARLHAHLTGSRRMLGSEMREMMTHLQSVEGDDGQPAFSKPFLAKLGKAYALSGNKHAMAEAHTAGLRMPRLRTRDGKGLTTYGGQPKQVGARIEQPRLQEHQAEMAEQRRIKSTRDGTKALDDFNTKLGKVAEFAHSTVKAGVMYGGVALQSASPDAFATLTGSFKLLAATVGTELVPDAMDLAKWLQKQAKDFEKLDQGTKDSYKKIFLWTTGIAGTVAIMPRLVQALHFLVGAFRVGASVIGGLASFSRGHPLLTGAGLAVGAATATVAYGEHQISDLRQHYESAIEKSRNEVDSVPVDQLQKNPLFEQAEKLRKSKGLRAATGMVADQLDEARRQARIEMGNVRYLYGNRGAGAEGENLGFLGRQFNRIRGGFNVLHDPQAIKQAQDKLAAAQARAASLEQIQDLLVNGPEKFQKERLKNNPKLKESQDQAKSMAYGMLLDFQSRVQPAYYGIEDMGKKIQLEALGVSPLQEEIRRIQIQQLDVLLQIAGYSKDQAAELKRNSGLP